jgi:hypothetical protein
MGQRGKTAYAIAVPSEIVVFRRGDGGGCFIGLPGWRLRFALALTGAIDFGANHHDTHFDGGGDNRACHQQPKN